MSEPTGVVMATAGDGATRLRVAGELDVRAVDRLRAQLEDAAGRGASVRVDLSRAGALPVALLRALAAAHRTTGSGGSLVVVDPSPAAVRVLRTSGLHRVLAVEQPPAPPARPARTRGPRRRARRAGAEPA
jgi:anti-anti-sigma factor